MRDFLDSLTVCLRDNAKIKPKMKAVLETGDHRDKIEQRPSKRVAPKMKRRNFRGRKPMNFKELKVEGSSREEYIHVVDLEGSAEDKGELSHGVMNVVSLLVYSSPKPRKSQYTWVYV